MSVNKFFELDYLRLAFVEYDNYIGSSPNNWDYFRNIVLPQTIMLGIRLKSERGLELFKEIVLPEERRKRLKRKEWIRIIGDYNEFVSSKWNFNPEKYAIILAKIACLGFENDCLDEFTDAFHISKSFQFKLSEMQKCLTKFDLSKAKNIFKDIDRKGEYYSAIEILAAKYFHLFVRSVVFLIETDPDIEREHIKKKIWEIKGDLEKFQKNSKIPELGSWERYEKAMNLLNSMKTYQNAF